MQLKIVCCILQHSKQLQQVLVQDGLDMLTPLDAKPSGSSWLQGLIICFSNHLLDCLSRNTCKAYPGIAQQAMSLKDDEVAASLHSVTFTT